jgi:hypothetical protein
MHSRSRFAALALVLACAEHAVGQAAAPVSPEPSFAMSIGLKDGTVRPGSEILVTVDLTNTSGARIELWRARTGPPPYTVQVLDRAGRAARLTPVGAAFRKGEAAVRENGKIVRVFPGSGEFVIVAPGETVKDWVSIGNQFDLSQPGAYTIRLERTDLATKLPVKSNAVTVTVAN